MGRSTANDAQPVGSVELEFNSLDDIGSVRVEDIEIDELARLRPIDSAFADAIGRAMLRDGQATPIVVCRLPGKAKWTLVAGAHRVAGARLHGIEYLRAEVIGPRSDTRSQREVSENLWRRGLDPFERAVFIAKQVEIIKARKGIDPTKDGRAASANARWARAKGTEIKAEAADASEIFSVAYGWSKEVADALGVGERTITRGVQLYRQLPPSLVERLRAIRHPAVDNASELHKLARLDSARQLAVVDLLIAGTLRVGDAISKIDNRRSPDPETKRLTTFLGAFQRMGLAEKKGALAELAHYLPAGFTLSEGKPAPTRHEEERDTLMAAIDETREVIAGILEDDIIPHERGADLRAVSTKLQLSRFALASDAVPLAGDDA